MNMIPLQSADTIIQFHVACAMVSLMIGPFALYGAKSRRHKVLGYTWVVAMASLSISSFFIHSFAVIGPFSPIHGLAIFTLYSLFQAIRHVIAGRIALHKLIMRNLYWYGLVIAGLVNFLPGRTVNQMFFADIPQAGFVVIGLGAAILVGNLVAQRIRLAPIRA